MSEINAECREGGVVEEGALGHSRVAVTRIGCPLQMVPRPAPGPLCAIAKSNPFEVRVRPRLGGDPTSLYGRNS